MLEYALFKGLTPARSAGMVDQSQEEAHCHGKHVAPINSRDTRDSDDYVCSE